MSKNKKLIPFGWLPGHIGLSGKTREIAKAEYELEGFELEQTLLEIKKDDYDNDVYQHKYLDMLLRHKKISEVTYHRKLAELIKDEKQKALAELELDRREGKIEGLAYEKRLATLQGEPWVNVIRMDFNGKTSLEGSFELDWNEYFVSKLVSEGYEGPTPDNIVNQWFMTICRNVAMEEFDGTGDFTADSAANLETMKRWSSESLPQGKKGYR